MRAQHSPRRLGSALKGTAQTSHSLARIEPRTTLDLDRLVYSLCTLIWRMKFRAFWHSIRTGLRTMKAELLIAIEPALKIALEKAARDSARPVPAFIERLLSEHLTTHGYLRS